MVFEGVNAWIEIFKGGKQVDSQGVEHDGDKLIEKAIAKFNPYEHEPPLVIGHPRNDSPAYGWVENLKEEVKDGVKVLLAKTKQVSPELEEMIKMGLYKKRSAKFYPDGRLRHVGFLGAVAPAVRGLKDVFFFEDETSFSEAHYEQALGESIAEKVNRHL